MASPSRDRDRERLERGLRHHSYEDLLARLQREQPFLKQFRTWADALAFMRSGTSADPRKDEILRPILAAHAGDQDPRWREVLLAIFWPGLRSIHIRKRHWDADPDERWSNITWTFFEVICRVDLRQRPNRLAQKVFNDTIHRLYEEYQRSWDRASREVQPDSEGIDALAGGSEGIEFAAIELREAQEIEFKRLRGHLVAGRISEPDFLLLVGTRIYGLSVADYARDAGLDYQLLKKRRQRAEAAIRRFEDAEPGGPDGLSPIKVSCPPLVVVSGRSRRRRGR